MNIDLDILSEDTLFGLVRDLQSECSRLHILVQSNMEHYDKRIQERDNLIIEMGVSLSGLVGSSSLTKVPQYLREKIREQK